MTVSGSATNIQQERKKDDDDDDENVFIQHLCLVKQLWEDESGVVVSAAIYWSVKWRSSHLNSFRNVIQAKLS